jgi:hypothetical protein
MEFKQLEVSDYHNLKGFFESQQYALCNYSLLSLIVWSNQKTENSLCNFGALCANQIGEAPVNNSR